MGTFCRTEESLIICLPLLVLDVTTQRSSFAALLCCRLELQIDSKLTVLLQWSLCNVLVMSWECVDEIGPGKSLSQ